MKTQDTLSYEIMGTSVLSHWKALTVDKYDDTMDSDEHSDVYVVQVSLCIVNNAIFCLVFPISFICHSTPPLLIYCFDTLIAHFGMQFVTNHPHHFS